MGEALKKGTGDKIVGAPGKAGTLSNIFNDITRR
jgi:hypothetical protein